MLVTSGRTDNVTIAHIRLPAARADVVASVAAGK